MQTRSQPSCSAWTWLAVTAGFSLLARLALFFAYPPVPYSDTDSYRRLAGYILRDFSAYDGTRTPGYPLFLALVGSDRAVYAAQLLLGLLVTLALFYLGWRVTGSAAFGALAGLAHTLNLGQLFFEANLLTETLTTFLVIAALLATYQAYHATGRARWGWTALAGLAAALSALVRPLFIFLPVWLALFLAVTVLLRPRLRISVNRRALLLTLLPAVLLIGGWVLYIRATFGVTGITVMNGFHLVQHTGAWFEDVPDDQAALRDIFLRYRDERIAQYGTPGNAIWDAIPEMSRATGYSFYQLSDVLAKISVRLIIEHPGKYLRSVLDGWWLFWRAPVYWAPGQVSGPALRQALTALVWGERGLLFAANLGFLVTSIMALVWERARRAWKINWWMALLGSLIWVASVVQTLLDHGDNPRFLVPLQSLVVLWMLWVGYQWLQARRLKASEI